MIHVVAPGKAPSFWFMGIRATVLSHGGAAAPTTMELVLPPGASTPLHVHDDDEDSGVVIVGTITTWCDGELAEVGAGGWLALPRARPHAQLVTSAVPARVIAVYRNGHFADFVAAVGTPTDREPPRTPPSMSEMARLREIAALHRLQILGPAPAELLARHA